MNFMTPDDFTNQALMLPVGHGHELYVQDWGKQDAKTPIIFLHGGPGGGCNDGHKGYFDPARHRVIFFDQRGSGQSTPYGSLEHNTTDDLVADIDTIINHFKLDKVVLCGRSWGSSLALAYAIHAPEKVQTMVIGGIFLADNAAEDKVASSYDVSQIFFPDAVDKVQVNDINKLWHAAAQNNGDSAKRAAFTLAQVVKSRLDDRPRYTDYDGFDPVPLITEAHYKVNDWFLPAGYIMGSADNLTLPVWIVQGRYDMLTVPKFAYDLHQKLPNSHLVWTLAGHSGNDRENWLATKTILEQLA